MRKMTRPREITDRAVPFLKAGLVLNLLLCLPTNAVGGEGNPDAVRGIVADHCTACHEVPGFRRSGDSATALGPSFRSIANQPELYTRARLTAFLRQTHYPMTKFIFSPSDIDNLIAFLESIRDKSAR